MIRWDDVTERIRAMLPVKTREEMSEMAGRIGVSESLLKEAIDGHSRLAAIKVVQALVRRGVDAKWMLTGEVDTALHRRMLDAAPDEVQSMIKRIIADASLPDADRDRGLSRPH